MSDKISIRHKLLTLGFKKKHITRAFKVYERNYGYEYNLDVLVEIIVRLQNRDKIKKWNKNREKAGMDVLQKKSKAVVQDKTDIYESKNAIKQHAMESEVVVKSDFVDNKEQKSFYEILEQSKILFQSKQYIVPATPSDVSTFENVIIVDTAGYENDTVSQLDGNVQQSSNGKKEPAVNAAEFKDEISAGTALKQTVTTGNLEFKYFYDKYMSSIPEQQRRMYFENLVSYGYNDIEMMLFLMEDNLKEEIGMSAIHVRLFVAKVEIFKQLKKDFERWIVIDLGMEQYLNAFLNERIVTVDIFYRRIQSLNKLLSVMGVGNENDCQELWNKLSAMNHSTAGATEEVQIEGEDYRAKSVYSDNRYTHVVQTPEEPDQKNTMSKCCCKMQ